MLIQDRYRLLKLISKGGPCQTWLAVDESQSSPLPCIVQQFSSYNHWQEISLRLDELVRYPQIPRMLAYFRENQYLYWVLELVEGTDLATLVEQQGVLNEIQIWQLLEDLLPVLKLIHERQIIHCDLKPKNIIRSSRGGKLVLVDFATAKLQSGIDQLTNEASTGSPEYIAPEQTQGKAVFASDLYSLGVTCIYLLTQIPPFDLFDVTTNSWVWRQYLTTRVSDRLSRILDQLIQNDPRERFQSAPAVMQAMGIGPQNPPLAIQKPKSSWQCSHTFTGPIGTASSINSLAFSPDGKILASGDDHKTIRLWDVDTKRVLGTLEGHTQAVKSIAFSPNGQILATASDDQRIKLWDINTFSEILTLVGHTHAVKSLSFSPDGQFLASGSWDKTVRIWQVSSGDQISILSGHQLQVNSVAFSPQGNLLASGSYDRTIHLWQLKIQNRPCYSLLGILAGHVRAVLTVAFSPNGQVLATGGDDNEIKLWDVDTGQLLNTLVGHSWSVVALAFSPDSQTLVSSSWDQTLKLWQVNTSAEIDTLCGHVDSVATIAVSNAAQLIASGSKDKTIKLWQPVDNG